MKRIVSANLSPVLWANFRRLQHAMHGASAAGLIRQAIEDLIDDTLRTNKDIRERYEQFEREARELGQKRGSHLRVVK